MASHQILALSFLVRVQAGQQILWNGLTAGRHPLKMHGVGSNPTSTTNCSIVYGLIMSVFETEESGSSPGGATNCLVV